MSGKTCCPDSEVSEKRRSVRNRRLILVLSILLLGVIASRFFNKPIDKKQVGKLFIVGYKGEEPSEEFLSFVKEWGIGGVIVFARNLSDPLLLPARLKKIETAAGCKIFTAIDQEGGPVLRILSHGSTFPSAMALSAVDSEELTEKTYEAIGKEMSALGLNWNLAPVLDINHPNNPGIGIRSFGDTPERVARFGIAAVKGLRKGGVLACAKHFPGKGAAQKDSHLTLPVIPFSAEHLRAVELFPFKKAIENNVNAIMTSHIFFPAFEKTENLPVTLSKSVLTDLLRKELGFKGLIITDDLEMGAITESFGVAQAALKSFMAGADQLLICHHLDKQKEAAEAVFREVENNPEAAGRLKESLIRIEKAKKLIKPIPEGITLDDLSKQHLTLIREASEKSIKFLRYDKSSLPIANDESTLFVLPLIATLVQVEEGHENNILVGIIQKTFDKAKTVIYDTKAELNEIKRLVESAGKVSRVVFMTNNGHLFKNQIEAAGSIAEQGVEVIVVALRNPYDIFECPFAKTCAATFGFRIPVIEVLIDVLSGKKQPSITTSWPVDVQLHDEE